MLTRLSRPGFSGSGECVGSGSGGEKSGAPIGAGGETGIWTGSEREELGGSGYNCGSVRWWWVRFELLASVRYGELRGRDGQVTVAQCFDLCGCAECEENVQ